MDKFSDFRESTKATDDEKKAALADVQRFVKASGVRSSDIQGPEKQGASSIMLSFRDFGTWQVPQDARNDPDNDDEDFEDYDWEEPTKATADKLTNEIKRIMAKHPKVKLSWNAEEKNWISVFAQ